MNSIRLSICIPTYNFGAFIGETLDHIVTQCNRDVEIVVLDSGSSDRTPEVVQSRAAACAGLKYHRLERRGGIDRDMDRVASLGQGEYCWLFSADDIMRPGSVGRVLQEIRSGMDIYLCGLMLCTFDMRPIAPHRILSVATDAEFDLSDPEGRRRYFTAAETTTAFFSFMSSLIVKRERWSEVGLDEAYVGSCWAHVVRIFRLIPRGLRVKYFAQPLLDKRTGNDSFMGSGLVRRIALAVDGFHRIANDLFGPDSIEAFHIRRVIANEYSLRPLLDAKLDCRGRGLVEDEKILDGLARKVCSNPGVRSLFSLIAYRYMPLGVYGSTRSLYRSVRKRLVDRLFK